MKAVKIERSWKEKLANEFEKPYFKNLANFVRSEYLTKKVFPHPRHVFRAFDLCPFDKVRVVIIGQDPYHGPGQAHGLCFSVPDKIQIPPSLVNIYRELQTDLGINPPQTGNLTSWAKQGVLLLNATLTVRAHQAGSHQRQGWEQFTDSSIQILSKERNGLVFLLWGAYAMNKESLIDNSKHLILKAPHPSPLSAHRGFFGCRHFSQANQYLQSQGLEPIDWFPG